MERATRPIIEVLERLERLMSGGLVEDTGARAALVGYEKRPTVKLPEVSKFESQTRNEVKDMSPNQLKRSKKDFMDKRVTNKQLANMRVRALYVKLDEARFFFDQKIVAFINQVKRVAEERFGLLGERWQADEDDEPRWSQLADKLTGCDISLREAYADAPAVFEPALKFDQVTASL